ncbi:unnamed protein product [Closterium sp. Yama58-4]|nr:unnamed protein product [Closterium sp. Yama58-4]
MATGGGLFGSTAGSSLFGQQQTTLAAPSLFGQQTPATPSPFGQQTQAAAAPSLFGQTTPAAPSPFGQSAPAFGAASTPAFGAASSSAFGATPTSAFGAASTPAFGAAATPAFGAASTPAFGTSTSAFGASTSAFGATTTSAFGATPTSAFGATPTSAFGAGSATPGFGGQLTLSQPQQQQQGALQQAQFAAQSAQWSAALPEREVAAIAAAYFGDARNPLGRFVSPFLSVTHPLARFRPPNVPELTWQEAIGLLAAAGPENQADGLWPEMVCGFSGLSKRLQVQDETIEADRQRLDAVEAAVGQVRAHVVAVTEGRQGAVRQRQQQLQQRVLRLMRLVEIMELRTSPHVPLSPTELLLSDRLQSLLRLLCSGASELPRKVESLAAAASLLADGGGEGGGADTGAGGAAGGAGGAGEGGGVRVEEWSLERMRGVVATQAEAVGRLAQLVERDEALIKELAKIRTGRASPGLLDHVHVEAYGRPSPLSRIATVTVKDPQLLSVTLHDASLLGAAMKGLQESPMGLNPSHTSHTVILVPIPKLTKEVREAMFKLAQKAAESARVSLRRARKEGMDAIKKAADVIPEDERKRAEKKVEEAVAAAKKQLEAICETKEKELKG